MVAILLLSSLLAAEFRTPASTEITTRRPGGTSILPGGRMINPAGRQVTTGPSPFGIAISPGGKRIVTTDGGPSRPSLTVIDNADSQWRSRTILARKNGSEEDDLQNVFQGIAFEGEKDLYVSEGSSGRVILIDAASGKRRAALNLNQRGYRDSYSGDLALDQNRSLLYVLDQANFRLAVFDTRRKQMVSNVRLGRLPFAISLSPDGRRAYITNIGTFEYKVLPGIEQSWTQESALPFPAFGFSSTGLIAAEQRTNSRGQNIAVPALGDPNAAESNSLAVVNINVPAHPFVEKFIPTGNPAGKLSESGSGPSSVVATQSTIYVSNGSQDSITVIDAQTLEKGPDILIRIPGLEKYRGIMPSSLAIDEGRGWLLVTESGMNAVGVIDFVTRRILGHIPTAWFPTRIALRDGIVYTANAKGFGSGPNATKFSPVPSFHSKGALTSFPLPNLKELAQNTQQVMDLNGFIPRNREPDSIPETVRRVVLIVKENRSFDEILGDIEEVSNGAVRSAPELARWGKRGVVRNTPGQLRQRITSKFINVTPNHHAIADRWAISDNFYADSETSLDGHLWLSGTYPGIWTERLVLDAGQSVPGSHLSSAPGRLMFSESPVMIRPESMNESGTIWHHLEKNQISFRNFGSATPSLTNAAIPDPLFRNTSRKYPPPGQDVPDQKRADVLIEELRGMQELPRYLHIQLPNDRMAAPRPGEGYPFEASFIADNDYALGRILEYLSSRPEWKETAVFITESNASGGIDHVDTHRTLLMMAGPHIRKNYVSRTNTSFPGMMKTVYRILGIDPLNLFDATARDLSDCFQDEADMTPFSALPPSKEIFDPEEIR